jgi:hypothetical protein
MLKPNEPAWLSVSPANKDNEELWNAWTKKQMVNKQKAQTMTPIKLHEQNEKLTQMNINSTYKPKMGTIQEIKP